MLTRFMNKSNRVKGLSLHPTRPWVLASLHNGVIQLWDYSIGTKIDEYTEHEGPVRGIDFHSNQPMFVSGGDDYKIKLWNYKLRRCLFTLHGHLDYVRSVQFHSTNPWIVSACDDQTIRVWDWQARSCISVLTGHNHYVMCASFHPTKDLLVSASLDQTVRVWDISGLRSSLRGGSGSMPDSSMSGSGANSVVSRINSDLFGRSDAIVKYTLDGHDRGVNWASFHPTMPIIASGADDNQIKLWRTSETKAWEMDCLRGHVNNVSCVIFHKDGQRDLIISNSEDRTIRVWDVNKRMGLINYRREHERFWTLANHPTRNLLAAGHDTGLIVFKLHRERPAMMHHKNTLFFVKEREVYAYDYASGRQQRVCGPVERRPCSDPWANTPRELHVNPFNKAGDNLLVVGSTELGVYDMYSSSSKKLADLASTNPKSGHARSAVFVARNKFAVLISGGGKQIWIRNFDNEVSKKTPAPFDSVDGLFFAGVTGRILLRSPNKVWLYEHGPRRVLAEMHFAHVKRVVWSKNYEYVALMSPNNIVIATRDLECRVSLHEVVRIKSGAWDDTGVFVYNTTNNIRYVMPNGDQGLIKTMDEVFYIARVSGDTLYCIDRDCKIKMVTINNTEYRFKQALQQQKFREVVRIIRNSDLCGQAIIAYLQDKGFPEVALHFVEDNKLRFKLALDCGNLEVAMKAAQAMNTEDSWHRLAVEAMRQGNHQTVELAYQQTKNFERLSFLYLITGNTEKLRKMLKIAEMRKDTMSRFHNALYLGNVEERVDVLERTAGQSGLAYLLAASHGLTDQAERLKQSFIDAGKEVPNLPAASKLLVPPVPILREENWPLINIPKSSIASFDPNEDPETTEAVGDASAVEATGAWADGDDDGLFDSDSEGGEGKPAKADAGGAGWGDDDDLSDLSDDEGSDDNGVGGAAASNASDALFQCPSARPHKRSFWTNSSNLAADHVCAGSFETAKSLLNRQIGVTNFAPLRQHFMNIFASVDTALVTLPLVPPGSTSLLRNATAKPINPKESLPVTHYTLPHLVSALKEAYTKFGNGLFEDVLRDFQDIVHSIPFVVVPTKSEAMELKELLGICREYITAVKLELTRKALGKESMERQAELSAMLASCHLQPAHLVLGLNVAMTCAYKIKNYIHAAYFAQRLLDLGEGGASSIRVKAQKVLKKSERAGRNEATINFDHKNPFSIGCRNFSPIYKGATLIRCPYCFAAYEPDCKDSTCDICEISSVGTETLGLISHQSRARTTRQ